MNILITGVDGYLGWSLAQHLAARGHTIAGIDLFLRRKWVDEMHSHSAIPIAPMKERLKAFRKKFGKELMFWEGDLTDWHTVSNAFKEFEPDAVVHLGENPSAPYSMIDREHAVWVQMNNITSTFNLIYAIKDLRPECHLLKLGTMGEYGTPNIDIPEGFFEIEYKGRKDRLPFPRQAGSWYHWSKVHGSNNIMFACRIYGLRSTDIMQGVVYGTKIDEMEGDDRLGTRLDFDQCFGTAINRFSCQAVIGEPLTPFGKGHQRRGFLPLRDSMQCLTLALEAPPEAGQYRVFNQFEETYDISELASKVQKTAESLGFPVEIHSLENPRKELEEHYYKPDHQNLMDLGYKPSRDMDKELRSMMGDLVKHKERILERKSVLIPDIHWTGERKKVAYIK